jgi:hypothetical protein
MYVQYTPTQEEQLEERSIGVIIVSQPFHQCGINSEQMTSIAISLLLVCPPFHPYVNGSSSGGGGIKYSQPGEGCLGSKLQTVLTNRAVFYLLFLQLFFHAPILLSKITIFSNHGITHSMYMMVQSL